MEIVKLNETDRKLLQILQQNSQLSTKEIASQLNLSVTPVYERIKKLERKGVISKYVALVNGPAVGQTMLAFCNIQLKEHSKQFLVTFEKEILKIGEVICCWHIAGMYDYLLKVVVADMAQYENFVKNKLAALDNISNVQSSFVMTEVKCTTEIPL